MKVNKWVCLQLLSLLFAPSYGQETTNGAVENIFENVLLPQYDDQTDLEQAYDNLIQFYQEPINLNSATADDLRKFFFLSERQINNIISYRSYYGSLLSQYELANIPGLDRESIDHLLPFIKILPVQDRRLRLTNRIKSSNNRYLILRQSNSAIGQKNGQEYEGSLNQLYSRLRISQPGSFSLGLTLEKDAGESMYWNSKRRHYLTDFVSAHLQIEKIGRFRQITIGDFNFQSGQQLVFGGGLGLGKGALTVRSIGRSQYGVKPYTSSTESGFFRGSAASLDFPIANHNLVFTALYSSNSHHAKLYTTDTQLLHFRSFDQTGLHRNESEFLDRKTVNVKSGGANLHFTNQFQNLQIGANILKTEFSLPLLPSSNLYKIHDFEGKENSIASVYYSYNLQRWYSFAELAFSSHHQKAIIAGLNANINSYIESVWLYRNYSSGFYSLYANAFGESTGTYNEEGLYWGMRLEPFVKFELGAYYDIFQFPWLRYRVDAPSRGIEYLLRAEYKLSRDTQINLQYRAENKGINVSADSIAYREVHNGIRQNLIFNLDHKVSERLNFRTKVHSGTYIVNNSGSRGWVVAQDVCYLIGDLKANARFALINTDDYNTRQYLYENDLLYTFSVPAYAGQGIRYYLLLRYKINKNISSWIRFGKTILYNQNDVVTENESIGENHKSQIRAQMIFKL